MTPFLSCVHTHTHFCDGKDSPQTMVDKALELGFVSLGFSSHSPVQWDEWAMKPESVPAYRAEILELQQVYADRLEILLGLEHDSLGDYPTEPYDYLIESVHAMEVDGQLCYLDWSPDRMQEAINTLFGGDPYAYAKAYFQVCANTYASSPAQIAGHIDLLTKFNEQYPCFDETDPRYLHPALEAVDCALERGMVLEVNTGAISRGYRTTPYPGDAILRHILQRGATVIVTSDCHDANYLSCHYEQVAEKLKSLGFRSTLRLRRSGFEEIGL